MECFHKEDGSSSLSVPRYPPSAIAAGIWNHTNFLRLAGLLFTAIGLGSRVGHSTFLCAIVRFSVLLESRMGQLATHLLARFA
jgi:hypothetical protein